MKTSLFTLEQKNLIIDLYLNKKISAERIAKQFNVCGNTIIRFLIKNNIIIRPISYYRNTFIDKNIENKIISDYIDKKFTSYEICIKYKICQDKFKNILNKNGLNIRKKNELSKTVLTKEQQQEIIDLHLIDKLGVRTISRKLKLHRRIIKRTLIENNIKISKYNKNYNVYICWKAIYPNDWETMKKDLAIRQSVNSMGRNLGKIPAKGCGNGWCGWYKGWFFRSLRELSFMVKEIEANNLQWESGESDRHKIEYIGLDGQIRAYYPDFIINNKIIIEVKPLALQKNKIVMLKSKFAKEFAIKNNMEYKIIDVDILDFEIIDKLVCDSSITFTDITQKKYDEFKIVKLAKKTI